MQVISHAERYMATSKIFNDVRIVESGTTNGWLWRKYADGTADCYIKLTDPNSATQHTFSTTLPFTFAENPYAFATGGMSSNVDSGVRHTDCNTTAVTTYVMGTWSNPAWVFIHIFGKYQ